MSNLYQISSRILHEIIDDEVIALDMQSGSYFSLRNTGSWIWHLLKQPISIEQIVIALTAYYRVDRVRASDDVRAFVARLQEEGLIESTTSLASPLELVATPLSTKGEPYTASELEVFTDVQELLTIDPIHDVDEMGWPHPKQMMS